MEKTATPEMGAGQPRSTLRRYGSPILAWVLSVILISVFSGENNSKETADFAAHGTLFLLTYSAVRLTGRWAIRRWYVVQAEGGFTAPTAPMPLTPEKPKWWSAPPKARIGPSRPRQSSRWDDNDDDEQPDEPDYESIADDDRWYDGETGTVAMFEYVDADGVVTDRRVRNWRSSGPYVYAYCLDRRGNRTFRKDRISEWIATD